MLREFWENREKALDITLRLLFALPLLIGSLLLLWLHYFIFPVKLSVGQIIPYNIVSPMDAFYIDSEALEKLTRQGKAYIIDPKVEEEVLLNVRRFFLRIRTSQISQATAEEISASISTEYGVPKEAVAVLLTFDERTLSEVETYTTQVVSAVMKTIVDEDRLSAFKRSIINNPSTTLPEVVAHSFLKVNIKESTEPGAVKEHIMRLVSHPIKKGEIILGESGVVTRLVLDKIEAVKEGFKRQKVLSFWGLFVLLIVMFVIWQVHSTLYKQHLLKMPWVWLQMSIILVCALALSLVIGRLPFPYIYYALPLGISAYVIMIVTIYDAILGLYLGVGISIIVALALGLGSHLSAYLLLSSIYPVVFLRRKSDAKSLAYFGLNLGVFNLIMALIVILVSVQTYSSFVVLYAFLAGFGSAVLALGSTPVLELVSTQATPGKLSSLLNQDHPLMKRLLNEAPGTYFHSLIMASMAEECCGLIGANALLAKVGAMYHDIGKLKRPGFFAENISDSSLNPHQSLPPESSCQIVVHHVTEGIELGKKYRLPAEVIAFIPEHHGRDVVKYFYEEAIRRKEQGIDEDISIDDYRYPGPNPCSKETAIVMIADTCEAIARSKEKFSPEEISSLVRSVIDQKISAGLLNDSGLSVADIGKIVETFTSVLVNLHHSRVKYPERKLTETVLKKSAG